MEGEGHAGEAGHAQRWGAGVGGRVGVGAENGGSSIKQPAILYIYLLYTYIFYIGVYIWVRVGGGVSSM